MSCRRGVPKGAPGDQARVVVLHDQNVAMRCQQHPQLAGALFVDRRAQRVLGARARSRPPAAPRSRAVSEPVGDQPGARRPRRGPARGPGPAARHGSADSRDPRRSPGRPAADGRPAPARRRPSPPTPRPAPPRGPRRPRTPNGLRRAGRDRRPPASRPRAWRRCRSAPAPGRSRGSRRGIGESDREVRAGGDRGGGPAVARGLGAAGRRATRVPRRPSATTNPRSRRIR